ncbi:MAG: type I-E CRISPR-associated protein Cas7/Cse4/CasC [Candidatus Hatepunaea meridiana]|nr:type I-E CRISPR-associated protein Cas7/Cse4/CasC [Candidatus Hatepunaea meridiana]
MNDSKIKIEVHLIQNFAPSNLNRDDTGQPKSTTFGGFRRARISSQCTKKSVRDLWRKGGMVAVGDRTKKLQELIGTLLEKDLEFTARVPEKSEMQLGVRVFTDAYYATSDKKKPDKTNVLVFISLEEVEVCAKKIKTLWFDAKIEDRKGKEKTVEGIVSIVNRRKKADSTKKESKDSDEQEQNNETQDTTVNEKDDVKKKDKKLTLKTDTKILDEIKQAAVSADIALFGRMLAEQPGLNTDGSCQVAHPISTHKVDMEMDFFTAVDDLNPEEETGAGMMGVVGFNSACYYRYALVDRDQLARNLARKTKRDKGKWVEELISEDYEEADKVIKAFLEAMVYAIPTGKQNSFAAQNLPSFGMFVRRSGGVPISLANAFAKPVGPKTDDDDIVGLSVARLTKHWEALKKVYGKQGLKTVSCFHVEQKEGRLNGLKDSIKETVTEAIEAVMQGTDEK